MSIFPNNPFCESLRTASVKGYYASFKLIANWISMGTSTVCVRKPVIKKKLLEKVQKTKLLCFIQIDSKLDLDEHINCLYKEAGNKENTFRKIPKNKRMLNINNLHSRKMCEI